MSIIGNPVTLGGTNTRDATLNSAGQLLNGVTAYADGVKYTGNIPTKTGADMTVSGATVTAPAGYYASSESKSVASGSAATPETSITANPSISVDSSTGLITASVSASKSITPTVSPGYVSSGTAGTATVSGSATSQLTTQDAKTVTPTTTEQTVVAAGKYTTGAVKVAGSSNLTAGNIKSGITIFGVSGTYTGTNGPLLLVKVIGETATRVSATKSSVSKSLTYDSTLGQWWVVLSSTGTWTVTAENSSASKSASVSTSSSSSAYQTSITLASIPSGYTLLQYAQFTGSQYIDLGSITSGGFRIKCTIIPINITAEARAIIGAQTYPNRKLLYSAAAPQTIVFCPGSADTFSAMAIVNNETYSIDASFFSGNSKFYLNGTNLVDYTTSYTPVSGTAYLGHIHYGDGTSAPGFYGKFQGPVEILNSSGTVTGRLFPVKNSSNVVGYYDTVRRSWIAPSGTLTAGPAA